VRRIVRTVSASGRGHTFPFYQKTLYTKLRHKKRANSQIAALFVRGRHFLFRSGRSPLLFRSHPDIEKEKPEGFSFTARIRPFP
jgi:hypothetical protein